MKLSEFIASERFHFLVEFLDGEQVRYYPFQNAVKEAMPEADQDTFPLAFCCPLFGREGLTEPYTLVNRNLPTGAHLPTRVGIYFLCDAIDCMAVKLRMNKKQVAEVVAKIETDFEAVGLDWYGRPKGESHVG